MTERGGQESGTSPAASDGEREVRGGALGQPEPAAEAARRASYRWALVLGLMGATAGAIGGWEVHPPEYCSEALVYIAPTMPAPQAACAPNALALFNGFIAFQVQLIQSVRMANLAMETETWRAAGYGTGPEARDRFLAHRRVLHDADTQHIRIRFVDPAPQVALAGVRGLIEAYTKLAEEDGARDASLVYATTQLEVVTAQVKQATDECLRLAAEYGGVEGLELRHRASVSQVLAAEEQLQRLQIVIHDAERKEAGPQFPSPDDPKEPKEPLGFQAWLADMLLQLDLLEAQERTLVKTQGEKSERVIALRQEIEVRRKFVAKYVDDWNRSRAGGADKPPTLASLKARQSELADRVKALRPQSFELGRLRASVAQKQSELDDLRQRREQLVALKDQLTGQLVGRGRIRIADPGSLASSPCEDERPRDATLAGALGAALGVLMGVLLGRRARGAA